MKGGGGRVRGQRLGTANIGEGGRGRRSREGRANDTVRRCFYFTGNLTLGLASPGEIAMDRASSVLDYDGMIALLIKRGGEGKAWGEAGARAPDPVRVSTKGINLLNQSYGLIVSRNHKADRC